jgi:hypothetical protein
LVSWRVCFKALTRLARFWTHCSSAAWRFGCYPGFGVYRCIEPSSFGFARLPLLVPLAHSLIALPFVNAVFIQLCPRSLNGCTKLRLSSRLAVSRRRGSICPSWRGQALSRDFCVYRLYGRIWATALVSRRNSPHFRLQYTGFYLAWRLEYGRHGHANLLMMICGRVSYCRISAPPGASEFNWREDRAYRYIHAELKDIGNL